MKAFLKSRQK